MTHTWGNHGYTNAYRNALEAKLNEIQTLSCNRESDKETAHDAIDAYMDKLNCAMRDSAVEAGCYSKQHVKPKRYWCPELSKLRDRKRFWWKLWVENGRPREGSVFSVYKDIKKAFRRRSGYHVTNQTRNEHYKLYEMIKARYMTGFWNVIKIKRSIQVKSSLTASDFNSFYGDVMQALPDSSHDQTCDKNIVDTYYMDNCQTMEIQTIDAEQVNQFIVCLKRGKAPRGRWYLPRTSYIRELSSTMRITSITIYRCTIDSICAEHIYDWRYHPSHKEIYTGSKCCETLSSNNNKFCTY